MTNINLRRPCNFSIRGRIVTPMTNNDLSSVDDPWTDYTRWRSRKGAFNNFIICHPKDAICGNRDKLERYSQPTS